MMKVIAALTLFLAGVSQACDAPVYRYALEKWAAGQYAGYIFYQRVLPTDIRDFVEGFKVNPSITMQGVDITRGVPPGRALNIYQTQARGQPMPHLVVAGPLADDEQVVPAVLMKGRAGQMMHGLADSPARQTIAEKILAGDCIVWTVVETGDPAQDEPFEKKLRELLAQAERDVLDPEIKNGRVKSLGGHKPGFPVVTVSSQDPAETLFVRMLVEGQGTKCSVVNGKAICCPPGSAPEKEVHAKAPLSLPAAFPIFGRGRVLDGLSAADLTTEKVDAACQYLLGKCSCEIKAQNPGRDLLFSVDWNDRVEITISDLKEPPELPSGLGDLFWPEEKNEQDYSRGGAEPQR